MAPAITPFIAPAPRPAPSIRAPSAAPAPPLELRAPPRRSRARLARLWPRTRFALSAAIAAFAAIGLLGDRGPSIAAWSAAARARISERAVHAADPFLAIARSATEWTPPALPKLPIARPRPHIAAPPVAAAPIRVAVNSDPWSNVEVDGVEAGSTPLTIELAPGPHKFRAAMADGRVLEKEFAVAADRNTLALR